MDALLLILVRALLALIRFLPIQAVALLGRAGGALFHVFDARHRRIALQNLTAALGDSHSAAAIRELARENFRRIGENFACAAKTAWMSLEELRPRLELTGHERMLPLPAPPAKRGFVVAIGHFGNFEAYARGDFQAPDCRRATTYRGLRHPGLDRLLLTLRERSGILCYERRTGASELRRTMSQGNIILGLLADQHAGNHGLRVPFFGRDCSTSAAPFVFARRYQFPLHTAICYRIGLARWRIEVGAAIPLTEAGEARSAEAVMTDMNRAFEEAIRRDPANWFWVHNRWKTPGRPPKPVSASAHAHESEHADDEA